MTKIHENLKGTPFNRAQTVTCVRCIFRADIRKAIGPSDLVDQSIVAYAETIAILLLRHVAAQNLAAHKSTLKIIHISRCSIACRI